MKSLYEITGRIEDINTVLVPRQEFDGLTKAARQLLEAVEDFQGYRRDIDTAIADLREAMEAVPQPAAVDQEPVSRDQIREVFMAHGFTIKDGQADLKQYVYDAAYALLARCAAPQPARQPNRTVTYTCPVCAASLEKKE